MAGIRDRARQLAAIIAASGYSVWWDRGLLPGDAYSDVIEDELDCADAVIVLWSETSRQSHWVRDEAAVGRDRNRLVPIALDGALPPLGFRQIHTLDAGALNAEESGRRSLLESLAALCARQPPPVPLDAPLTPPNDKSLKQVLGEERRQRRFMRTFWITSLVLIGLAILPLLAASRFLTTGDGITGMFSLLAVLFVPGAIALILGRFLIVIGRRLSKRKSTRYFDGPTNVILGLSVAAGLLLLLARAEGGFTSFFSTQPEIDALSIKVVLASLGWSALCFPVLASFSIPIGFVRGLMRTRFEEGR